MHDSMYYYYTGVDPTADNWLECFIKNVYLSTPHV